MTLCDYRYTESPIREASTFNPSLIQLQVSTFYDFLVRRLKEVCDALRLPMNSKEKILAMQEGLGAVLVYPMNRTDAYSVWPVHTNGEVSFSIDNEVSALY